MRHYLYRHIRLDKNEPFYIGIGTKSKKNHYNYFSEYYRAYNKTNRKKFWKSIVAKTGYEVEILLESDDYNFIKQKEIEFIILYGRKDLGTGTLVNLTDGGEGTVGYIFYEEVKKKMSKNMKDKKGELHHRYGKKHTEEWKIARSLDYKGKFVGRNSPNWGKVRSEEYKRKSSESRMGKNTGEDNVNSKKVINLETKEIFPSVRSAAKHIGMNEGTFLAQIKRRQGRANNTGFIFLAEYEAFNVKTVK